MKKKIHKIKGSKDKPRISVFRSNKYIYVQLIDDESQETLIGLSEKHLKEAKGAKALGLLLADKAKGKKITKAVFDRGNYAYHGAVKLLAEGAREGGLKF